jgi:hypothetical protein
MPTGEIILTGFGLQLLKPKFYGQGTPLPVQQSSEYPEFSLPKPNTLAIEDKVSYLGTPVFCDIKLEYEDISIYYDTVLMDVSQHKNIVKTAIVGRNGTVKEYINDSDYSINVKGAVINHGRKDYPIDQVNKLVSLAKLPYAIKVICPYLRLFSIFEIVIESYDFSQRAGFSNMQLFNLNCISESPIELIQDV